MRVVLAILKWALALLLAAVVAAGIWLYVAPPALIRVATGYAAKMVCSNVFLAGRDPSDVLEADVQAPGHPIMKLISIDVDRAEGMVRAGLFGLFGDGLAVVRAGTGCATVPDGDVVAARWRKTDPAPLAGAVPPSSDALWPEGAGAEPSPDPAVAAIIDDPQMTGPGMRAVVAVHRGRIVGERYGEGFSRETPLLGWSMTKTVNAAIIGTLVARDRLSQEKRELFEAWKGGERASITLANMMAMSSGLAFNEDYGDVTDVTRMLFLEPNMAGFAVDKPLVDQPGNEFSYSSGTSVALSRLWQDAVGDEAAALEWPREALFGPLGMESAILETDARGTFVGSSYLYATAQDWARFGQFLLQAGAWDGRQILPQAYVEWMRRPAPASGGDYGYGQLWLHGPSAGDPAGVHPDAGFDLPDDTFWMLGHDGQSVAIVPSLELVVVRLGLTPSALGYKPQRMVEALTKAVK